jgi:transcriptional regulator with XRE-family HTH domain
MELSIFAKNILFLRKGRKIIQSEMFDYLGIMGSTWSNYENGVSEPNFSNLIEISRFFEISVDDLLTTDLKNVYLFKESSTNENTGKSRPKSIPNSIPKLANYGELPVRNGTNNMEEGGQNLDTWVVMGQLKTIDEKIDLVRVLLNELKEKKG